MNEEVNRKVCVVDHADYCESEYDIKIKKCPGDTFVYQLSATPAGSGYCFGEFLRSILHHTLNENYNHPLSKNQMK